MAEKKAPTKKKFDPQKKEELLSPERQKQLDVFQVTALIPIFPHHEIADVGCGPGFFTLPLAKHVFDGKVYAVDVQQEMLDVVKERMERIRLTNIEVVLSKESKLPLDDDSLDGALAAFVVHEAKNPKILLTEIKRCLRRGGWLAVIEWQKIETEDGPPVGERIDEAELRALSTEIGYRSIGKHILNNDQYMLIMRG